MKSLFSTREALSVQLYTKVSYIQPHIADKVCILCYIPIPMFILSLIMFRAKLRGNKKIKISVANTSYHLIHIPSYLVRVSRYKGAYNIETKCTVPFIMLALYSYCKLKPYKN